MSESLLPPDGPILTSEIMARNSVPFTTVRSDRPLESRGVNRRPFKAPVARNVFKTALEKRQAKVQYGGGDVQGVGGGVFEAKLMHSCIIRSGALQARA